MVLEEIKHEEAGAEPASFTSPNHIPVALEHRLAAPIDRLAATVADFVLFSPVMTLVMSPFKRQAVEAQLAGNDEAWMVAIVSGILAAGALLVLAQTLCLIKWRATPGKMIFGLRVESLFPSHEEEVTGVKQALNPMSAFLRSVTFCFELLLLGFPWLAILGNERRRPFHDRIADTVVISKRARRVGPPNLSEIALSSGILAACLTSLAVVITFKLSQFGLVSTPLTSALNVEGGDLCQEVTDAEHDWIPGIGESKPDRISVALSLYEADAIDEECLKREADHALWNADSKDLGYLARGLAEKDDEELAQSYLDKACETDKPGDACTALTLLRDPELPEDQLEAKAASVLRENQIHEIVAALDEKSAPFLKIIAIRELSGERNDLRALTLIESFPPQKELGFFLTAERTKALWNLDRQREARLALRSAISAFDPEQRVTLSRWFCQNETSVIGCSAESRPACDWLSTAVENDQSLLRNTDLALTYMRGESCSNRLSADRLAKLEESVPDEPAHSYIKALRELAGSEKQKGVGLLQTIASDSEKSGAFFFEANARLVELAQTVAELTKIRESWIDTDPEEDGWMYLGLQLMDRYNTLKAWDQTLEIGFKLGENGDLNRAAARSLVVAAYRAGQPRMAVGYLEMMNKAMRAENSVVDALESTTSRQPASTDGFEEILRELRKGTH